MQARLGYLRARINRGRTYVQLGALTEAIGDANSVLLQAPGNVDAFLLRADAREARANSARRWKIFSRRLTLMVRAPKLRTGC